jgi:hypothetical protein
VVVPSRNEPFGIVVLEAWASGKPVVATTSGGPRDFVKPGEDGYLVDPSPNSIAWGCCKIMENFKHSEWMGKNAQAKAAREFSWDYIAHQTQQIYYELLNFEGAPRSMDRNAGYPLASPLLQERCFNMGVVDGDPMVARGLSILKLLKLLVVSLGGDAALTWMGNEFAQIDPIDVPRPANGFNDEFCRIKYELADNSGLEFSHMERFEQRLNRTAESCKWLSHAEHSVILQNEEDKVLAYARGKCIFVFNFHPESEYTDYCLQVPSDVGKTSSLSCVLTTNDARFDRAASYKLQKSLAKHHNKLSVDLPPRTAFVFAPFIDGSELLDIDGPLVGG